jgi:hypothetical protein
LDAANPELICDFGYSQFLKGNLVSAEQLCRRALNLNPNLQRAHNNLGLILAQTGKPEAAIQQFQMAGCDMTQAQQNLELVRQSARAHGITPTALPDIVQGQAVAQAPMRRTSLPTSAAPSVAINAPTAPAEDAPMSGLQPAAAQASSTVALKPMPQSRSPSYSTTVAQVESKPVAMTFSAPAVASESLQRPAPAQPKVAAAHQPASTNSPPALKSEAIATTQGQPTKVPSSPIARLNYYATDPTAAPPSQPTRAIGSALATPSSAGNPPQEFARPAKATRVGSTDSTAGVKLTLSSGEEVEKIESKKPATPRSGVERKLGDLD